MFKIRADNSINICLNDLGEQICFNLYLLATTFYKICGDANAVTTASEEWKKYSIVI